MRLVLFAAFWSDWCTAADEEGGPCYDACDECLQREAMLGTDQGCDDTDWQGRPGPCLAFSEGVCTSFSTGRPLCAETPSQCPDHLRYCNPTGCTEGLCTCMETPNPPLFHDLQSEDTRLYCSSSCIIGECDECCGCVCGAEWDASGTDIASAAGVACNRTATTACTGTQPGYLPFIYADSTVISSYTTPYQPQVLTRTCASPTSTHPVGLGPDKAATSEAECEQWAQQSGGTYGGMLPADIYGCYRPATYELRQSAEIGSYTDNRPDAPWYFSNTGNGAPGTFTGGQCSPLCTVPTHCMSHLGSLNGGSDCCGCLLESVDSALALELVDSADCRDECASLPQDCLPALLCPGVCPDVPDACAQGGHAFGCLTVEGDYSWFEQVDFLDPEEWDGNLGIHFCGEHRITCSTAGTTIHPAQYDCLCAEVGGKTCDLQEASVCPHRLPTWNASVCLLRPLSRWHRTVPPSVHQAVMQQLHCRSVFHPSMHPLIVSLCEISL